MAEPDFSLMLEHFKRVHEDSAALRTSVDSLMDRAAAIEGHMAAFHVTEMNQYADLRELRRSVERIERRLGLREEA
jgi:hypothetical protein